MNTEMVSSYRETEQAIIQSRPLWAAIGFAIAVFGGALGGILLLLKKNYCLLFVRRFTSGCIHDNSPYT